MEIPLSNDQRIMVSHENNTGHKGFLVFTIAKKLHVKCKDCEKIVWH